MLNFQKFAFDITRLRYDHSLSSCSTSSNALNRVIFIPPTNNDNSKVTNPKTENVSEDKSNKGKSILGAPPKVGKKETKQNIHHFTNKKSTKEAPLLSLLWSIWAHSSKLLQVASYLTKQ